MLVLPRKMKRSIIVYMTPGMRPNAVHMSIMIWNKDSRLILTSCIQKKGGKRAILGLESFQKRREGNNIQYEVEETHVKQGERIQSIHCKPSDMECTQTYRPIKRTCCDINLSRNQRSPLRKPGQRQTRHVESEND